MTKNQHDVLWALVFTVAIVVAVASLGCHDWRKLQRGECVENHPLNTGLYCASTPKALRLLSTMMYEHDLPSVINANVWWHAGYCVTIEGADVWWRDYCVAGEANDCDLDVSVQGGGIADSTLAHEALHCSLWLKDGNADGGHIGPYWMLPEGEWASRLRAAGL